MHGYVTIKDGADAVRFLKTLHARCWLGGLGWMNVGSAGQLLERSIIDRMVGASGTAGVRRTAGRRAAAASGCGRRPTVVVGGMLDTVAACPPLSIVEQQAFDRMRAQVRTSLAAECAARRAAWIAERMAALMERTGMSEAAAAAVLEKQTNGLLLGSVELPFDDPIWPG